MSCRVGRRRWWSHRRLKGTVPEDHILWNC